MELQPLSLKAANAFIETHHRHHGKVQGHKFSIGLVLNGQLVGCVVVGRPVARMLDDGYTAEVTRMCSDGTPNACSKLYSAAAKSAAAMGYRRMITYILVSERGTSLKASGWLKTSYSCGGSWSRPSRRRNDTHPLEPKVRWEKQLHHKASVKDNNEQSIGGISSSNGGQPGTGNLNTNPFHQGTASA